MLSVLVLVTLPAAGSCQTLLIGTGDQLLCFEVLEHDCVLSAHSEAASADRCTWKESAA